jgi:hypothetical protein
MNESDLYQIRKAKKSCEVKAVELLPEIKLDGLIDTIHQVFFAVSCLLNDAIESKKENLIRSIFMFASWCNFQSNYRFIENAVAVSFYEHMDSEKRIEAFKRYGNIRIFKGIKVFLDGRISSKTLKELEIIFAKKENGN